jgi:phosphate uptake regulator
MAEQETYRRKIQLVAGVTYTLSLPKKWVQKQKLKDKDELSITESGDGSLMISPHMHSSKAKIGAFHLDIDAYTEDISQMLFVLYYLGAEDIVVFSKKEIPAQTRSKIKDTVRCMVGTEIVSEDSRHVNITVLLDKERVSINQIFYRISLLLKASIGSLVGQFDLKELERNEEEIDRLYHLISKIIVLSHTNAGILLSSGIGNSHYLTSYLLIGKKLESIGDSLYKLALYTKGNREKTKESEKIIAHIREHIEASMKFLMNREHKSFTKTGREAVNEWHSKIQKVRDVTVLMHLDDMMRYMRDVEEELTNISFYHKLIREKIV